MPQPPRNELNKNIPRNEQSLPDSLFEGIIKNEDKNGEIDPEKKSDQWSYLHNLYTRMATLRLAKEMGMIDRESSQRQLQTLRDAVKKLEEKFEGEDGFRLLQAQMEYIGLPEPPDKLIEIILDIL